VIRKFTVRSATSQPGADLVELRRALGLADLVVWRDYYIELAAELSGGQAESILAALADGVATVAVTGEDLRAGEMVQVAHRAGIVDNESSTIVAMCRLLGVQARAGKAALTYVSASPRLAEVIGESRCNSTVEELHRVEPCYESLLPAGVAVPAERYDLVGMAAEELADLGRRDGRNLSPEQMRRVRRIQQVTGAAAVTDVLLEALDARWSDHCSHTTWRSHGWLLDRLVDAARDTGNPNIVSMFVDNAGVWDFYDGAAVAIKAETHNGPSAVAAYFGQLTKVGGVLRDIMGTGLGADPIGCFEYTATGPTDAAAPIAGRPAPRQIAADTVRAVKEYANTFGVPMMFSHLAFHPGYRAKPFALGGAIGVLPKDAATRRRPLPGDLVVLVGGLTGDEGIHGASASSAGSSMNQATVQIGAPLEQVKFRKALVELRDAGCLRALTDVGGAGLNSAVGEIGEPGGVWVNTALVPLKTSALPMWRILLSESQERMLLAVPPGRLADTRAVLDRHLVRGTVVGRFTDTGRYCVVHDPGLTEAEVAAAPVGWVPGTGPGGLPAGAELGFDLPYELAGYEPAQRQLGSLPVLVEQPALWPDRPWGAVAGLLQAVVADPEVASQLSADQQYDSTVQGNTVHGPHYGRRRRVPAGYWAATPVDGSPAAVVITTAFDPWLFDNHPVRALRQMFCRLLARQVLAGVSLADVCVCDNFYTPHLAAGAGEWLVAMVDELAGLVRLFGTPVISGKDSSAGSTHTDEGVLSVPPAVFLSALGKVPDAALLTPEGWQRPGHLLVRIGPQTPSAAGTVAGRVLGITGGCLDDLPLLAYRGFLHAVAASRHLFHSAELIGPGGLAARLVTTAVAGDLGVRLRPLSGPPVPALFAEHRCAALVELDEADLDRLPAALEPVVVGRLVPVRGIQLAAPGPGDPRPGDPRPGDPGPGGLELLTAAVEHRWSTSFGQGLR
jgi:phosphoribosylformylglycinamidine (FGAM) synthase-like enzyme